MLKPLTDEYSFDIVRLIERIGRLLRAYCTLSGLVPSGQSPSAGAGIRRRDLGS